MTDPCLLPEFFQKGKKKWQIIRPTEHGKERIACGLLVGKPRARGSHNSLQHPMQATVSTWTSCQLSGSNRIWGSRCSQIFANMPCSEGGHLPPKSFPPPLFLSLFTPQPNPKQHYPEQKKKKKQDVRVNICDNTHTLTFEKASQGRFLGNFETPELTGPPVCPGKRPSWFGKTDVEGWSTPRLT